jgi:hypothetical protein
VGAQEEVKVLCLTEAVGNDPSYRARVLAYLPTLANAGFHVEIIPFAQNAWRRRRWDVLWIRRSGLEEAIADELSGKPVVYDFDDAMFCLPDDLVRTRTRTVGLVTRLEARFANAIRAARVEDPPIPWTA